MSSRRATKSANKEEVPEVASRRSTRVRHAPTPMYEADAEPKKRRVEPEEEEEDDDPSVSAAETANIAKRLRLAPLSSSSLTSRLVFVLAVHEVAKLITSFLAPNEVSEVNTMSHSIYALLEGEDMLRPRLLSALRIQSLLQSSITVAPGPTNHSSSDSNTGGSKEACIRLLGCSEHEHQHCYTLCAPCPLLLPVQNGGAEIPTPPAVVPLPLCRDCKLKIVRSLGHDQADSSRYNRVYRIASDQYELAQIGEGQSGERVTLEWWSPSQWRKANEGRKSKDKLKVKPYAMVDSGGPVVYVNTAPANLVQKLREKPVYLTLDQKRRKKGSEWWERKREFWRSYYECGE